MHNRQYRYVQNPPEIESIELPEQSEITVKSPEISVSEPKPIQLDSPEIPDSDTSIDKMFTQHIELLREFSLKNQYTNENGNTIIYPVRMHKKRISVTAEFYGSIRLPPDYIAYSGKYEYFMNIIKNSEFSCDYKNPYSNELFSGYFTVTSDITVTKIMADNPLFYAVSFTIEEV